MHKLILGLTVVLLSNLSIAQDSLQAFSYYFVNNTCKPYESGNSINLKYWGTYGLIASKSNQMRAAAGDDIVIDETGVYIAKNKILSISREEIRENSKYIVKNGYLHGVSETDSFAVALQDELYYFLMPSKAFLYEKSNTIQKLYQVNTSTYLILSKEDNGFFSGLKISIKNGTISLAELDLTYSQAEEISHSITTENNIKTYLMNPSKKDWAIILNAFEVYDSYQLKQN